MPQKVTLIKIRTYHDDNINEELKWFGNSLGLFGLRDRDSSCFRIFITLVKSSRKNDPISSDQIAEKLNLTRGTVVHHLKKLMDSGIVLREKEGYLLRENSMENIVKDIQRDIQSIMADLENVAKEIDEKIG